MLDRLKKENKYLKRQLSSYKKQLDRLDPSNIEKIKEFSAKQEERREKYLDTKKLKDKWKCFECGRGTLYIVKFPHPGGLHYFRSCDFCDHRTKAKPYTEKVKGICKAKSSGIK